MSPPCFLASGPINGRGNCSMAGAEQLVLRGRTVGYGYLVVIWVAGVTWTTKRKKETIINIQQYRYIYECMYIYVIHNVDRSCVYNSLVIEM